MEIKRESQVLLIGDPCCMDESAGYNTKALVCDKSYNKVNVDYEGSEKVLYIETDDPDKSAKEIRGNEILVDSGQVMVVDQAFLSDFDKEPTEWFMEYQGEDGTWHRGGRPDDYNGNSRARPNQGHKPDEFTYTGASITTLNEEFGGGIGNGKAFVVSTQYGDGSFDLERKDRYMGSFGSATYGVTL